MDERRHNMDGALFVDEDRQGRGDDREKRRSRNVDDGKADDARRVTQGILDRMDLEASARVREEDDERVVVDIEGPDAGRAIGKKGMTLEALQFLVNKIVNRDPDERRHIVLDSGDYRERHDNSLVSMAKREAKRAVSSGRAVTLEPMSARDRRVIHVSLAKFPGVSTRSEGEGAERRLQIIPVRGERGSERTERSSERSRDDRPRSGGGGGGGRGERRGPSRERSDERRGPSDDRPRERTDDRGPSRERTDDRGPSRERTDDRGPSRERTDDRGPSRERSFDNRREQRSSADDRSRGSADDRGRERSSTDDRSRERPVADDWSRGRDEPDARDRDDDRGYDER
ncbi:MAG: KH domain-containing protein [Myxococcales bacterium]